MLTDIWRLTFWDLLVWEGEEIRGWEWHWKRRRKRTRKKMNELVFAEEEPIN